jgi:RHS repeat-associated protein
MMRRPASITVTTPTGVARWSTGTYAYDGAGNISAIGPDTFNYDKVSRLKTANLYLEPTSSVTFRTQTYTYDAFGNILTVGGNSARNTPTSASTNHLTSGTYDASGNLTSLNGSTYAYDPFNLMWNYRTLSDEWIYLYTAGDERAWSYKTDNTSLWTLRGPDNQVLREYTNNGAWTIASDYIYRGGSLLAAETPQGIRHFHLDHLGTPRLVSDNLGQQKAYHVYYPFGEEATAFNQDTIRAKFTGHERDLGNSGGAGDDLDYMHARHCSPLTARFLSTDVVSGKPKAPQSWNRYAYAQGNPIRYVDRDGLETGDFSTPPSEKGPPPSWSQSLTTVALVGGAAYLAVGGELVLAGAGGVTAGASTLGEGLTLLGAKFQGVISFFRDLAAGLTGTPSVSNPIAGEFGRQVTVKGQTITALANASTKGTSLVLDDFAIYADKAKATVGAGALKGLLGELSKELQKQGYTQFDNQGSSLF